MTRVMAVSLSESLYEQFRARAKAEDRPYSRIVSQALATYLATQQQDPEAQLEDA